MATLTEQEIAMLTTQLATKEGSLRATIDAAGGLAVPEASEAPGDDSDVAEAAILQARDDAMLGHYRMELADIAAARRRMQDGAYGICVDCEEPIPFPRLQAYPTAKRCTACQRRHERVSPGGISSAQKP